MFYQLIKSLDKFVHFDEVKAHCDIPCGIYDPHQAQVGALTVIRMIDLIKALPEDHHDNKLVFFNSLSRYIAVKEEHAELVKHEIRVIQGDFIKEEHLVKYPELQPLVFKIMKLASKVRQGVERQDALDLLAAVNRFAEIFWEIKGVATKKVKAPYAPAEEVVYPVL